MKKLFLLLAISLSAFQSFAQWTTFVWDTITFEDPYEYLTVDNSSQNIWQIGAPNKTFFDGAYLSTNAIVTDTVNFYPVNNNSHFDLKIGTFNFTNWFYASVYIEMKHKYDTDTLHDGGYISVSYDQGLTWMNIIDDTTYFYTAKPDWENENLYQHSNTLFNGESGFSGHSNGWVTTMFAWHSIPVKNNTSVGDTMIIRFNFVSDNIEDNKEGWMIDNIKLYSVDLGGGVNESKSLNFTIAPNPMNETSWIEAGNYCEILLNIFNTQGEMISQRKYVNNQSVVINKDRLEPGMYFVKIQKDGNFMGVRKLIVK